MTAAEIITLIFTSSLLSAILTSYVNIWLQKNNYQKDYYKKLLDKRLNAYESVSQLTSLFSGNIQLEDGRLCQSIFALGKEHYFEFEREMYSTMKNGFWLSEPLSLKLMELNLFLVENVHNTLDKKGDMNSQLINLGVAHRDELKTFRFDLDQLLYKELSSLHKIEKFTKTRPKTFGLTIKNKSLQKQS